MGILVWQVLSTGFFSKQTLLFSTLVNLYQFYYLFPLRNRTTDVATIDVKKGKRGAENWKKNQKKRVATSYQRIIICPTFTRSHSILELIFRTNHFNLYKFFVRHVFLFSWRRQSSLKLGPLSSTIFICAMRQIFEFTVSTTYYLYLSTYKSYYY